MTLVCPDCFGDNGLKRRIVEIRSNYPNDHCDFHPSKKGVPISAVAEIVDPVFRNQYTFGNYHPQHEEFMGDDLSGTLYELTEADDDRVVTALSEALINGDDYWPPDGEDAFYLPEGGYVSNEAGYQEHSYTWRLFRHEIRHDQRFFNESAKNKLAEIFDGLHILRDERNSPAIYALEPNEKSSTIFRARKANNVRDQKAIAQDPASQLGPPPENLRRAGRMNPSGILAFYGAFDLETCVAELRPAVGETVMSAQFELNRPIFVLDTTKFTGKPKAQNVFAPTYIKRMRLWKFMTVFMNEIARPCLPDDEHLDYITTQVVSEYLTRIHKFKHDDRDVMVEAIIFNSAQHIGGKNIVIFGDAANIAGPSAASRYTMPSKKAALKIADGSLAAHEVSGVSHKTVEIATPEPDKGVSRSKDNRWPPF